MSDTIYRASRDRPEQVPAAPTPVVDGPPPEGRGRAPRSGSGASTPRGTAEYNGRVAGSVSSAQWVESWSTPLGQAEDATYLLAGGGRVYVGGGFNWRLQRLEDGELLTGALRGRGEPCLDPRERLLLQPDGDGQLQGLQLEDGQQLFWASLFMGDGFRRPWLGAVGEALFIHGLERPMEHGTTHFPELSCLEQWPLNEPMNIGPTQQLRPGAIEPVLLETLELVCAGWRGGVVAAEPGRVLRFNAQLQPEGLIKDERLKPVALSLDEAGWMYLLIDEGEAEEAPTRALWVVDREGVRRLRYPLPRPLQGASQAPIVGHGHRITLQGGGMLLTLEPDGAIAWARPIAANATPALVTPDDDLILGEGQELVAFDARGQRRVVHTFAEELSTAPVPTTSGDGRLVVASRETLFCLVPVPE